MLSRLPFQVTSVDQVGFVVRDIDRAMETYWRVGIGPWRVYTYGAPLVKDLTYRGKPGNWRFRIALAGVGGFSLELIQPLSGENIYSDFLEKHGEGGIQHLGFVVQDMDRVVEEAQRSGYQVIQSGRGHGVHGDGKFAYLSTEDDLLTVYEVMELVSERRPPERVYPEQVEVETKSEKKPLLR
ncbi:MAG: VOC family protein [candidate division NC10 bacterium]|nr:VOC family protein [candidate division NC10 bacterium]